MYVCMYACMRIKGSFAPVPPSSFTFSFTFSFLRLCFSSHLSISARVSRALLFTCSPLDRALSLTNHHTQLPLITTLTLSSSIRTAMLAPGPTSTTRKAHSRLHAHTISLALSLSHTPILTRALSQTHSGLALTLCPPPPSFVVSLAPRGRHWGCS